MENDINETRNPALFIGCVNMVKDILNNPKRLSKEEQLNFMTAIKELKTKHDIKPSVKTLYSYAELKPSHKTNDRIRGLIRFGNFDIRKTKQSFHYWVKQSNGNLKRGLRDNVLRVIEI